MSLYDQRCQNILPVKLQMSTEQNSLMCIHQEIRKRKYIQKLKLEESKCCVSDKKNEIK